MKSVSLIGAGGMAREIMPWIYQSGYEVEYFYDSTVEGKGLVSNVFRPDEKYIIAVGYPDVKQKILNTIKNKIIWEDAIVHPLCVFGNLIKIGQGSIICPLVVLTKDIELGNMTTINTLVTIGHECRIGDMFHASPGSTVSGNVRIGDRVFLGANAVIKEKLTICNDVIIGAGAVVVKDIKSSGIYAGNPAKKIKEYK